LYWCIAPTRDPHAAFEARLGKASKVLPTSVTPLALARSASLARALIASLWRAFEDPFKTRRACYYNAFLQIEEIVLSSRMSFILNIDIHRRVDDPRTSEFIPKLYLRYG